jgi:hypothetical protein
MPFDSQIRLRQLHNPELSGFVIDIITKYLNTGSGVTVNTGTLTGVFYPLKSNPSGYLSSIATGGLVDYPSLATSNANLLAQIDLVYYPRSNPSGFGTGNGSVTGFNTGDFASIVDRYHNTSFDLFHPTQTKSASLRFNQTGFYLDSYSVGTRRYIDIQNAILSGYDIQDVSLLARDSVVIKSANGAPQANYPFIYLDLGGKNVSFLIQSTINTGLFYDVMLGRMNMSGISGWGITGTNAFALLDKTSTGFKYWQGKEYYQSGSGTKIDFYKRIISGFEVSGYLSNTAFNLSSGYLDTKISNLKVDINALSGTAVLKDTLNLYDESGIVSVKWGYSTRELWDNESIPSLAWDERKLYNVDGPSLDWRNHLLIEHESQATRVNWDTRYLTGGIWNAEGLRTNDLLVSGQPVLTGSMTQFLSKASGDSLYYPTGNPNNYVTASYVSQFATKTDAVSRTSLSQNQSLHLTDTQSLSDYNNFGFKNQQFFYMKGPSGRNVIDFYLNTLTGFSGNFSALTINGKAISGGSVDASFFVKHGVTTANTEVMFNGTSQTSLDFKRGDHFYLRDEGDAGYLIDIYGGEIDNFAISSSGFLGFLSSVAQDYTFFANDIGVYLYSPDFSAAIDLESKFIAGLTISSSDIKVNSLPVLTQIVNTGIGSGIYSSTDGFNTAYLKTLVGRSGINISGSGNSLVLTVTGIVGGASVNTGQLTGEFYPLTGNPSGFILPSQTGQYASSANLQLTGATLAAWTGTTTNLYYPLKSNPSGYVRNIETGGFLTSAITGLSITGGNSITGRVAFSGVGGLNIVQSGNTVLFSGGAGGTSTGFLYLTGSNPTIIDNYSLTSGLSSTFVPFASSFTGSPYVFGSLMNTGTEPLVPYIISGTRTSGFFLDFGDPLPGNKYSFTYIATTQLGLLAVSSGYTTINVSGNSSILAVNKKVSNYTLSVLDDVILADSSSSLVRLSLPSASTVSGKLFKMKRINSGDNSVVVSGTFIDGETGISLVSQYQSLSVISDGSGYYVF